MAADLIRQQAAVIFTTGGPASALAAETCLAAHEFARQWRGSSRCRPESAELSDNPWQKLTTNGSISSANRRASALSACSRSTAASALAATDQDLVDAASVLRVHDLVDGVVERHEIHMIEV
jgi:hypothetical protein